VVENRSNYPLTGLPNADAVAAAGTSGSDLRTVTVGGIDLRLYTVPIAHDGSATGYVQGGIRLALHDRESRTLVLAIAAVGAVGLVGAALITLLVTGRALRPVRDGFEAQRRFVADASHELRTPAALIRANAEVLEREQLVSEEGREFVTDIVAEADRLGLLVGDLLQLAAWDDTKLAVAIDTVDAASLASDTVRGATALAAERGVELAYTGTGPVPARADRDRLVQLLLILVDNAMDHSPKGTTVTVRVRRAAHQAVIEVEDEGPGIPPDAQERIFEPFTRLHGTTRHGSGGTGLGLAIARRITDAMSGTISVSSPEGAGAKFTVTLPTGEPSATPDHDATG
jgi:signal transduction histidine kinase